MNNCRSIIVRAMVVGFYVALHQRNGHRIINCVGVSIAALRHHWSLRWSFRQQTLPDLECPNGTTASHLFSKGAVEMEGRTSLAHTCTTLRRCAWTIKYYIKTIYTERDKVLA